MGQNTYNNEEPSVLSSPQTEDKIHAVRGDIQHCECKPKTNLPPNELTGEIKTTEKPTLFERMLQFFRKK